MANRYWVGGTATWDATAGSKWSTTSGGAGGSAIPTAADDVFFDAASGAVTVTTSASSVARSINCTGFTGTLTHHAGTIAIGDATPGASNIALKLVSGMTYTLTNATTSAFSFASTSSTQQTVEYGTKTPGNQAFTGNGGNWRLLDGFTATGITLTHTRGTLDINGQTISIGVYSGTNTNTRTLTLGAANITVNNATGWNATGTNLTVSANTATVTMAAANSTFAGGSANYNGLTVTASAAGTFTITGDNTFGNITRNATAVTTDSLQFGGNQTVTGTLTTSGNSTTNRLWVQSTVPGVARTITVNTTVSASYVGFEDITAAGSASWNLSAITGGSGDTGGNTGITFTPATTRYAVVAGNASSTAMWSTSSGGSGGASLPLSQDTVVFDANSAAGTYTWDLIRGAKDIVCTGFTRTLSIPNSSTQRYIFGSLTLSAGMTFTATGNFTFAGRGSHTITMAGKAFSVGGSRGVTIGRAGGSYTFTDQANFGSTGGGLGLIFADNITITASNSGVIAEFVNITGSATVNMGTGTWDMRRTTVGSVWTAPAGATINASTSTILVSNASANARTFDGGGKTYGTLTYTVAGSTGSLAITGANTFAAINFSDVTNARTLILPASTVTTVPISSGFNVNGTSGKLMSIVSSSSGTPATIQVNTGRISGDYLSIQDVAISGNTPMWAGVNSTNVSGNSGIAFSAPVTFTPIVVMM